MPVFRSGERISFIASDDRGCRLAPLAFFRTGSRRRRETHRIVMTSNSPSSLGALARELFGNDAPTSHRDAPAAPAPAAEAAPATAVHAAAATPALDAMATPMTEQPGPAASAAVDAAQTADTANNDTPRGDGFVALGLSPEIVSALTAAGYQAPTPVQQRAIPAALAGRDLLVSSPTGSGKTAAFMLPAIERFAQMQKAGTLGQRANPPVHQAQRGDRGERRHRREQPVARPALLVLTPTRELAMQVTTAATTYGKHLRRLRTVSILGGVAYGQQLMLLAKNPEILVATPGRLIDHLERGRIDLSQLQMMVLDEADRMLDMGFIEDIEAIIDRTPATRQTLLFSATLDGKVGSLAQRFLSDAERIEIRREPESRANIAQSIHYVDDRAHKDRLLTHLLADGALDQAIVFTATKNDADVIAARLAEDGFASAALHGDLPQGARNRTIRALRERRVRVLVATDVAARGIDIPGITHVFNYDLPKFAEDYVHRIGRTGRAGRSGIAVSLVHHAEVGTLKRIERFVRTPLPVNVIAGFEPKRAPSTRAPARRGAPPRGQGRGAGGYQGRGTGNGYGNARHGAGGSQGGGRDAGYRGGFSDARASNDRGRGGFADSRGPARRRDDDRRTSRYDD
ncbi:DEAD/DEAH box helicase [Mycetohabitans sp. B8]|uniref:DEAD/DEAH box helicase n=1 Tax=Mycetohabitans sp. B8 TaxID=2841845 RepID=UPI001F215F95|nr:DEAD/DEAH box helicase [Mycetohabitans sp. B8]MCG1041229.1 DEAD/DEAH box helicase [Mycetohabitans sp. B8]